VTQAPLNFDGTSGPAYVKALDQSRLSLQHERIRELMLDGRWRLLSEISEALGYPEASVSAQLRHLRKSRFGGFTVERRRSGPGHAAWQYRVLRGSSEKQKEVQP
jgi:hypothetical protein